MLRPLLLAALCLAATLVLTPPSRSQPADGVREIPELMRAIEARAARGGPPQAHAIVEFTGTLSTKDFENLRAAGASIRARPSSRKWFATVTIEGLRALSGYRTLRTVRTFRPADKESQRIDRSAPAEWQLRPNGRIAYRVVVFDDATIAEVEALQRALTPLRLEDFNPAIFDRKRSFTIVIDPSKLDVLLAADIVKFVEPPPGPRKADNLNSARLARIADIVDPNDPDSRLTGDGVWVSVAECCARDKHQIRNAHAGLAGRIVIVEAGTESRHATHVAGTISSRGTTTRGMAPGTRIYALDEVDDVTDAVWSASPPSPASASNHSYGAIIGWNLDSAGVWKDTGHSDQFGTYTSVSEDWDRLIAGDQNQSPVRLVVVKSAGNDRNDVDSAVAGAIADCSTTYAPAQGDCIEEFGGAKNVITVGAVDLTSAVGAPEVVAIADFSSFGPTDDGRIKPDVVADGVGVISTGFTTTPMGNVDATFRDSGTSMAAPVVTGVVSLMTEALARRGRTNVWPSTYKALLVQHARDVTVAPATLGPDYATGFGIVDAAATMRAILDPEEPQYRESWIRSTGREGRVIYFIRVETNLPELAVTLAWSDPASDPPTTNPSTDSLLESDLDLRLIEPDTGKEWAPLRPTVNGTTLNAATRGDDDRNNVEKVIVPSPRQGLWMVQVTAKEHSLSEGGQEFSLAGPIANLKHPKACAIKPAVCALPAILRQLRTQTN